MNRALAFTTALLLTVALAAGRAGYRVEVGSRFTVKVWAEEVLWQAAGLEQVAGAEVEYTPLGFRFTPYTGLGYVGNGWWVQAQVVGGTDRWGIALIGGWSW